ncbi:MAG: hypothetical protein C0473_00595 [Cyanobacteria bacterium DS3.002]|nr:hypothetical protein [Cyanobacteria bacterium DS3.002]MBA4049457.1 hypothetical protein [Cyanobacteria bacterium DS2.008]MBA4074710.1 hypothetical protein [Cyanobacteria bacterium PR.023]
MSEQHIEEIDDLASFEEQLAKLRKTLQLMSDDEKYSSDDQHALATEALYTAVRALSKTLRDQRTEFFQQHLSGNREMVNELEIHIDNLARAAEQGKTGVELIGAVEKVLKILHPGI